MERLKLKKQTDIEIFTDNRLWLLMAVTSVMIFLCLCAQEHTAWKDLIIDMSALQILTLFMIVIFSSMLSIGDSVCYTMFLSLFSNVGYVFIVGMIACLLSILVRFIIDVKKKKKQIHFKSLIFVVCFVVIFSLINHGFDGTGFTIGFMIIYISALIYLLFENKEDINISKCFTAVFFAFIISLIFTIALRNFLGYLIYDSYILSSRIRLFAFNTNFLAMHAMFQIAFAVYSIFNKKRDLEIDVFAILISLLLGLGTKSKAFFVLIVFIILYSIICLIKKYKTKSIVYILFLFGFLFIGVWFTKDYILSIIERFFGRHGYIENIFSKITTGRSDIWQIYMKDWLFTPTKIMFGAGIFTKEPYYLGIHNSYLFILYRFGILGTAAILAFLVYILRKAKFKITVYNFIILAIWLLLALEEVVLGDQFTIYLILGLLMIMDIKPQNVKNKEIIDTNEIMRSKSCKKKSKNIE